MADNQDLYLCLLAYRNTVIDNLASPAQLLMDRPRLRSNLPVGCVTDFNVIRLFAITYSVDYTFSTIQINRFLNFL